MRVRRIVLDAITMHARRDSPRECCGLLIGTNNEIIEAVAATNVAVDPHRRYEISPTEYLVQIRRCRDAARTGNAALIIHGGYHSHPHSLAAPSPTDQEHAFEEFLYIIAGPVEGEAATEIRGYRFTNGQFEDEELIVV